MRAALLYYLVQSRAAELHRQAQRDAPARAASQARRTRTPRPWRRAAGAACWAAAAHDQAGHRATTPGTGRGPPPRPPAEFCRAGGSGPGRGGRECGPRGPRHRPAGPGGGYGPDTWAPAPAAARPAGREPVMSRIRRIGGYLAGLARWAGARPGYGGAVAAALAGARPDPPSWLRYHWPLPPRARGHPVLSGGLPSWQITLLAAVAALLAAAIAVTVSRRRARRRTTASSA
jgi:hypothetical protein